MESANPLDALFFTLSFAVIPFALIIFVTIFYFIHRFITMNTSPFRAMQAIYVYVAALIGLALVAMGLYGVVSDLLGILLAGESFDTAVLVLPFTQLIVGLFVMVPHWAIGHHFHLKEKK